MELIKKDRIKVALIANTGFGNEVFNALLKLNFVEIDSVLTRKLDGEFPYFKTEELHQIVELKGIKCFYNIDANGEYFEYLKYRGIDLIIVATFNQILKKHLIDLPKLGIINYHSSLLPKFKGPSPIIWGILKGEQKTGVTIHYITPKIDNGDLLFQKVIKIENDECLGSLFLKSSLLAGQMTTELMERYRNNSINSRKQSKKGDSYFKRPTNERILDSSMDYNTVYRTISAFHPFPKALFKRNEILYKVNNYSVNPNEISILNTAQEELLIVTDDNKLPLFLHLIRENT